jgi:hypothetical protein
MNKIFLTVTVTFLFCSCKGGSGKSDLMYFHRADGKEQPVKNLVDWEIKCKEIRDSIQALMGPFPPLNSLPPLNVQYIDSLKEPKYTRYTIRFTAAENESVPAYLYVPACSTQQSPAMLALHPTSNIGKQTVDGKAKPDRGYGRELAQRGYVVIAPDYPGFGELSDYDFQNDRYLSGSMAGIFYHVRCVDILEQLPFVDKERIGVIGHSLGGHNAMYVAAFDSRLKLIISSFGWTENEYYNVGPAPKDEPFKNARRLWRKAQNCYTPLFRDKYHFDDDAMPYN